MTEILEAAPRDVPFMALYQVEIPPGRPNDNFKVLYLTTSFREQIEVEADHARRI